jgi:hypothetical protein
VLYDPVPLDEDWLLSPEDVAAHSSQQEDDRDEEQEQLEEQLQQHPEQARLQQVNPAALRGTGAPTRRHTHDTAVGMSSTQQQQQQRRHSEVQLQVLEPLQEAVQAPAARLEEVLLEPAQQQQQQEQEEEEEEGQQEEQQPQGLSLQRLTSTSSMKASPFTTAHDAAAVAAVGFSSSKPGVPSRLQQRSNPGDPAGGLRASQSIASYDPAAAYVPGVATAPPPRQNMHRHHPQQVGNGATLHSLMSERGTTTSSSRQRRHEASEAAAQAAAAAAVAALHSHSMLLLPSEPVPSQPQPQPSQPQQLQHQASARPERRLLHQASSKILGAFSLTQQPSRVSTVPSLPPRQEAGPGLEEGAPGQDPELLAADRRAAEVEARASEYRPDVGSAGGGW